MRFSKSTVYGVLGVMAGLVATAAIAGNVHPAAKGRNCTCPPRAAGPAHRHRAHVRTHRGVARRIYVDHRGWSEDRGHEQAWRDEQEWRSAHGWREDDGRWTAAWADRPWATDAFGFLTWPGKSHFVDGHYVQDGPPPPPNAAPSPPEAPPPPPPGAEESHEIYRF